MEVLHEGKKGEVKAAAMGQAVIDLFPLLQGAVFSSNKLQIFVCVLTCKKCLILKSVKDSHCRNYGLFFSR